MLCYAVSVSMSVCRRIIRSASSSVDGLESTLNLLHHHDHHHHPRLHIVAKSTHSAQT